MNTIIVRENSITQDFYNDSRWLQFFDVQEALSGLNNHLKGLPSHETPEKYTWDNYQRGVQYFIEWAGGLEMRLPTTELLTEFVSHLRNEKVWYSGNTPQYGVSASTVASSYLAPVRIFLKKLVRQRTPAMISIDPFNDTPEEKEMKRDMRDFFIECKELMRTALDEVKNPRGKKTNVSALYNPKFNRLKLRQVQKVLRSRDRSKVSDARDYCIFRLGVESALRVAEIQRVTLSAIRQVDDVYTITVRGKRNNFDPVPISNELYLELVNYVALYNSPLGEDDPRRIGEDTPIFQALRKGDNYYEIDNPLFDPQKGLSKGGIRDVIKRVTETVLGIICTAHDLRRTCAAIADKAKMKLQDIQTLLRHADGAITLHYIGNEPNFTESLLTRFVDLE